MAAEAADSATYYKTGVEWLGALMRFIISWLALNVLGYLLCFFASAYFLQIIDADIMFTCCLVLVPLLAISLYHLVDSWRKLEKPIKIK